MNDLSKDEQLFLYTKTKELKLALANGEDLARFRLNDDSIGTYIIFLEDSTRTKESFKNAALFHDTRLNVLDAGQSSFNKNESYADTIKMLCGYNEYSIFIMRTKLEGVTKWLEIALSEYAERNSLPRPSFINGGDGKHEHPTQEFLDEYTFYEQKQWKREHIHIALIGDLYHGRTVHSKANGLNVFKEAKVDLVAPPEIGMPRQYLDLMKSNGFEVRVFGSIEEYLGQPGIAGIWYFTRLQLERMGEDILEKRTALEDAVTFKRDYLAKIPEGTKFYHPLPRNRENPTIPFFLDPLPMNGWEEQALNGYYTRIIEIAMLGGKLGDDFEGEHPASQAFNDDFIEEVSPIGHTAQDHKVGIRPITTGIVIDHIGKGDDIETVWDHIYKIRRILDLNMMSSHGVFNSDKTGMIKGIISLPDIDKVDFEEKKMKKLAAIAPGCTINFIRKSHVEKKYRLHTPPRVYNFDEIGCTNPDCISHPSHHENVQTEFTRSCENIFICKYCEKPHRFKEIWNIK